jgi:hypothetical protein
MFKKRTNIPRIALIVFYSGMSIFFFACLADKNPNKGSHAEEVIENNENIGEIPKRYAHIDSVYVPIYSDIYSRSKDVHFLLTATLSIRNTSYSDSLLISTIDYFDTQGELVRNYLDKTILIKPMASIDYVINQDDDTGGTGANFIVILHTQSATVRPVIQSVMISTNGQQGIAFTTEGISISKK